MDQVKQLSAAILRLANDRGINKTICPSEVARQVAGSDETEWRALMPAIRKAAVKLAQGGKIEIKKGGSCVDPGDVSGIYRIAVKSN